MTLEIDIQLAMEGSCGHVPSRASIESWVLAACSRQCADAQLTIRIVDYAEMRTLNENYRGKTGVTNVLSFPFAEPERVMPPLLGDIVICGPQVEKESRGQGKPIKDHWAHLVVHGVLHLLGYDHLDDTDATLMESLETNILSDLGIPDPYRGDRSTVI